MKVNTIIWILRAWTYDLGKSRANGSTGSNNDWFMPQRLEFGARNNNSENSMGQIAEFMMFHGKLSDQDRQKIEGHLAFKYGLTLDTLSPFYYQQMVHWTDLRPRSMWVEILPQLPCTGEPPMVVQVVGKTPSMYPVHMVRES